MSSQEPNWIAFLAGPGTQLPPNSSYIPSPLTKHVHLFVIPTFPPQKKITTATCQVYRHLLITQLLLCSFRMLWIFKNFLVYNIYFHTLCFKNTEQKFSMINNDLQMAFQPSENTIVVHRIVPNRKN